MIMKKLVCLSLTTILCIFGAPLQVFSEPPSANLVGTVLNTAADPVPGIEIIAKDPSGKPVGQSVTDKEGQYVLKKLPVGKYGLKLDPIQTGYQGATVVTSMVKEGLTVNWTVSNTAPAVAIAAATPDAAVGRSAPPRARAAPPCPRGPPPARPTGTCAPPRGSPARAGKSPRTPRRPP